MMKKTILILLFLILAMSVASAGTVVIDPTSPSTEDTLNAFVEGEESTSFDFYWIKDGATYKSSTGSSSSLGSSVTDAGEIWTVSVWVPESAWYDSFEYGSASVTIEGDVPTFDYGNVVIDPSEPCDEDNLTGYVEGYEDTTFDFYWMRDGSVYLSETDNESVLDDSYTAVDDTWILSVWVPESAWYDSFEIGSASVTIDSCDDVVIEEDETYAPAVTDIFFSVDEGEFVNVDVVYTNNFMTYFFYSSMTDLMESQTIYVYDSDSLEDELRYEFGLPLADLIGEWQTVVGDAGVYETSMRVMDTDSNISIGNITITVNEEEVEIENICPVVSAEDITVYEGELAVADYIVSDADGDILITSFSEPMENNGLWQTEEGDAGVYEVTITVTDNECEI
ncbi:hypothetical protein HOG31_02170, partial [archaeon]|nr:hypothetical protein [archaeon]